MTLVRYNSNFDDLMPSFSGVFSRLFNDSMSDAKDDARFVPSVDIIENDKAYNLNVAVPGMSKEDFHLDLSDNTLTISGERKFKEEKKEGNYYSFETQYGSFTRTFRVPKNVIEDKIEATYRDGILHVVLPKGEDPKLKSTIKIK